MPHFQTPTNYSLHYTLHGDGHDKVLFIMGFACCKSYWFPMIDLLLEQGQTNHATTRSPASASSAASSIIHTRNKYEICAFDSRGFGQSGDTLRKYSSFTLAQDILGLLQHLGWVYPDPLRLANDMEKHHERRAAVEEMRKNFIPPPLHVVGWSMGGMVSTELTLALTKLYSKGMETDPKHPIADFRSSVIVSSSRGGFRHRGEKHDAEPIIIETDQSNDAKQPSSSVTSSFTSPFTRLRDYLNRSAVGRYGWGNVWIFRNIPPISGLWRIFRIIFLSLYHSRVERVLELHYSLEYLDQPYVAAGTDKAPPKSALSHLPLTSAALTSSTKSTLSIHPDTETGGFTLTQDYNITNPDSDDDDDQPDPSQFDSILHTPPLDVDRLSPIALNFDLTTTTTTESKESIESKFTQHESHKKKLIAPTPSKVRARSLSFETNSPVPTVNAFNTSFIAPPSPHPSTSSTVKFLTNRDVLTSQYTLRAPFDRYIFLYCFALLGHGLTCLTHHVSRKRIKEFMFLQNEAAIKRKDPHLLRMSVITGSSDILVHPSNSFHLSQQLECPLYVLAGVGHMVHVEQPDTFAQLLHAHFTRSPIEHLQAYTHSTSSTPQPPSPMMRAGSRSGPMPDTPRMTLTVTRLDALDQDQKDSLANDMELDPSSNLPSIPSALDSISTSADSAASSSSRRRNSFLIQIDGAASNIGRNDSSTSLVSHDGSSSSLTHTSTTPRMIRRPSLASMRFAEEEEKTKQQGCLTRVVRRITSLPLATARSTVSLITSTPSFILHHILHPFDVVKLPSRFFHCIKRKIGGEVQRTPSNASRGSRRTIDEGESEPTARVRTN